MNPRPWHILFLCTGNSARSILAEAIANRLGEGRSVAHSAGSTPTGQVNPHALSLLRRLGYPTEGLRSKSWSEFAGPDAAPLDFIVTVCDNAAGEACPIWPGRPISAHWGMPDPAAVAGSDAVIAAAFAETYRELLNRINAFVALRHDRLDRIALQRRMQQIGGSSGG